MLKQFLAVVAIVLGLFSLAEAQDPNQVREHFNRATQRYNKGDFDGAIAEFTRVIVLSTGRIRAQQGGQSHFTTDISGSDPITFVSPMLASAYGNRGVARYKTGDIRGALADCDQAISLNPGIVEMYNNRGLIRWKAGDLDGALVDFSRVIKIRRTDAQTYDNRGEVYLDKKQYQLAEADFTRAITLNPREPEFYYHRSQARRKMGRMDEALTDCDYAISADAQSALGPFCRGTALYANNDLAGAVAGFQKAIELEPQMAAAHRNLGWALWDLGREADSEREFAEYLRLDPSSRTELERQLRTAKAQRAK